MLPHHFIIVLHERMELDGHARIYSCNCKWNWILWWLLDGQLVLVFEYMETDLWRLISGPNANVPLLQIKCIMRQLFEGLYQCHTAGIMHRDVKRMIPHQCHCGSIRLLLWMSFTLTRIHLHIALSLSLSSALHSSITYPPPPPLTPLPIVCLFLNYHTASNLLINSDGVLKLADFGLTTSFVKPPYLSNNVVSLYYRPPELLMGSHSYGPEIDMWSAGTKYSWSARNHADTVHRMHFGRITHK